MNLSRKFPRPTKFPAKNTEGEEQFILPEELFPCMPRKYPFDQAAPTNRNTVRAAFSVKIFPFLRFFLPFFLLYPIFIRAFSSPPSLTHTYDQNYTDHNFLLDPNVFARWKKRVCLSVPSIRCIFNDRWNKSQLLNRRLTGKRTARWITARRLIELELIFNDRGSPNPFYSWDSPSGCSSCFAQTTHPLASNPL